jgi:phenylacetate-CoA ligase
VEVGQQVQWLRSQRPQYLLTYPNNLRALAARFIAEGTGLPGLLQVRTIGETVTQAIREDCRKAFGVALADVYSSEEVGGIALQCPAGEGYHIQSESVLVEVLDDAGTPCAPGEVGRIVVTPLHNFAMPLLRYELRDYAEVGEPCPCGRGLPVLRRILGRSRNMLVLPNGERRWPLTGFAQFREIAPISQFQFEQESLSLIEARIVAERALSPFERTRLIETIQTALCHPFEIRIVEVAEIPRSANGKFEDFISRLDASMPDRPGHEQN